MEGIVISLVFAFLAGSTAWQSGRRAWSYYKIARDFLDGSTQSVEVTRSGRTFLFAAIGWGAGAFVLGAITILLIFMGGYFLLENR